MLNDGFQYIEQRDEKDNITHAGVVSKKSPFVTSDNRGILDVIAEDLRFLRDESVMASALHDNATIRALVDSLVDAKLEALVAAGGEH